MKIIVITAITAGRDGLKEDQNVEGADFVAFCDRPLPSATWRVLPACDLFRDPVRNAKIHKILPQLFFPDYDASLWIDATLELVDPAPSLVERYLADRDLVFGLHGAHRALDDEIAACLRETMDDPEVIRAQTERYRRSGGDGRFPLASVVLRRHTPAVARFNCAWWAQICRWSRRDQLSLLEVAAESGLDWAHFPRSPELERHPRGRLLGSPHFRSYSHGTTAAAIADPTEPRPPEGTPAWRARRLEFLEALVGQREAYAFNLEEELQRRSAWAHEAEQYARSLEQELQRHAAWAREAEAYARSLEGELARRAAAEAEPANRLEPQAPRPPVTADAED